MGGCSTSPRGNGGSEAGTAPKMIISRGLNALTLGLYTQNLLVRERTRSPAGPWREIRIPVDMPQMSVSIYVCILLLQMCGTDCVRGTADRRRCPHPDPPNSAFRHLPTTSHTPTVRWPTHLSCTQCHDHLPLERGGHRQGEQAHDAVRHRGDGAGLAS
jgi:hypothetical protein